MPADNQEGVLPRKRVIDTVGPRTSSVIASERYGIEKSAVVSMVIRKAHTKPRITVMMTPVTIMTATPGMET